MADLHASVLAEEPFDVVPFRCGARRRDASIDGHLKTNPERLLATPDPSRDADEWLGRLGEIERALRRRGEAVDAALEAQSAGLRGRLEEKLEALESKLYKLDATNHALESKLDAVLARLADQGKRPREGDHG